MEVSNQDKVAMALVHVKYFAQLREARNLREETLDVIEGTTALDLYCSLFPQLHASGLPISYAVNGVYAKGSTVLNDADEVAFLPPVGGG